MSKNKSLGSSPIGYSSSGNGKYNFIPDLGVSSTTEKKDMAGKNNDKPVKGESRVHVLFSAASGKTEKQEKPSKREKKIVSYYLEEELINELKDVADNHNIYYSALVSDAVGYWIKEHDYD